MQGITVVIAQSMKRMAFALVMLFLLSGGSSANASSCLIYGPSVVELTGTLEAHTYPGPPNFESVGAGDKPLRYFRLALATPVCAFASSSSNDVSLDDVSFVQLVLDQNGYNQLRPHLGKMVRLKGKLFSANNAFHQEPLLLQGVVFAGER